MKERKKERKKETNEKMKYRRKEGKRQVPTPELLSGRMQGKEMEETGPEEDE
jgi:hypothetical protein